jgi:hypothetical protein
MALLFLTSVPPRLLSEFFKLRAHALAIKGGVKKRQFCAGSEYSCSSGHLDEQDLF